MQSSVTLNSSSSDSNLDYRPPRSYILGDAARRDAFSSQVAIRPASATLWVAVGCCRLVRVAQRATTHPRRRAGEAQVAAPLGAAITAVARYLAAEVVPAVGGVLGLAAVGDRLGYGAWTLPAWNFVRFNVLEGGSAVFGAHPWHWHFSQGIPAVLGAHLPLVIRGVAIAQHAVPPSIAPRSLLWLALWYTVALSVPAHKEFRFLLPLLPLLHVYAGYALAIFVAGGEKNGGDRASLQNREMGVSAALSPDSGVSTATGPSATTSSPDHGGPPIEAAKIASSGSRRRARAALIYLGLLNVPAALYLSLVHQVCVLRAAL